MWMEEQSREKRERERERELAIIEIIRLVTEEIRNDPLYIK